MLQVLTATAEKLVSNKRARKRWDCAIGEFGSCLLPPLRALNRTWLSFRCGSRKHTLSRCNELEDPSNPFPFASCFVCSGRGHLASSCPKNESKGIYPNGGCCRLCGETTHLAKDCQLRKKGKRTFLFPLTFS